MRLFIITDNGTSEHYTELGEVGKSNTYDKIVSYANQCITVKVCNKTIYVLKKSFKYFNYIYLVNIILIQYEVEENKLFKGINLFQTFIFINFFLFDKY